jgi:hypothetical protein
MREKRVDSIASCNAMNTVWIFRLTETPSGWSPSDISPNRFQKDQEVSVIVELSSLLKVSIVGGSQQIIAVIDSQPCNDDDDKGGRRLWFPEIRRDR